MRNKFKPIPFMFPELIEHSVGFDMLYNYECLRPTQSLFKRKIVVYNGRRPQILKIRPCFQNYKIKSFIFYGKKRGAYIRSFFKAKPKKKTVVVKKKK